MCNILMESISRITAVTNHLKISEVLFLIICVYYIKYIYYKNYFIINTIAFYFSLILLSVRGCRRTLLHTVIQIPRFFPSSGSVLVRVHPGS